MTRRSKALLSELNQDEWEFVGDNSKETILMYKLDDRQAFIKLAKTISAKIIWRLSPGSNRWVIDTIGK